VPGRRFRVSRALTGAALSAIVSLPTVSTVKREQIIAGLKELLQ